MKSFTLREWCELRRCSRSYFYRLLKDGKAPRTFLVGCQRRVTEQADAEWLAAREAEAMMVAA
ncbi:helix-turn-helix transcriptional regulator [Nitrobacter sp. JJSN]|uniref:helix-turn-helix transcriptional regulator n=1 Tax=Nitrobacter sp. JJSN TaxID=3453033 RepID=UPI003F758C19